MGIPRDEFQHRIQSVQRQMAAVGLDALLVYGDEYRKENLRYVSNYWPIFERVAAIIPCTGDVILLAAPEGQEVACEMSAWSDIRMVKDFTCVTVPDEIEYPLAHYTSFQEIRGELGVRAASCSGSALSDSMLYRPPSTGRWRTPFVA